MPTDYEQCIRAGRARRRRESSEARQPSPGEVWKRAQADELRYILLQRHPELNMSPSRYASGNRSRLIGDVVSLADQDNLFLFIVCVGVRESRLVRRRQAMRAMEKGGKDALAGRCYDRREWFTARREYHVTAWDGYADDLRVINSFTTRQEAVETLRLMVAPAP